MSIYRRRVLIGMNIPMRDGKARVEDGNVNNVGFSDKKSRRMCNTNVYFQCWKKINMSMNTHTVCGFIIKVWFLRLEILLWLQYLFSVWTVENCNIQMQRDSLAALVESCKKTYVYFCVCKSIIPQWNILKTPIWIHLISSVVRKDGESCMVHCYLATSENKKIGWFIFLLFFTFLFTRYDKIGPLSRLWANG